MECSYCNSVVRPEVDLVKASETGDWTTGRDGRGERRRIMLQLGSEVIDSYPIPHFHSLQQYVHRQLERRARRTVISGRLVSVIASRCD
jgi:hypothetical protein